MIRSRTPGRAAAQAAAAQPIGAAWQSRAAALSSSRKLRSPYLLFLAASMVSIALPVPAVAQLSASALDVLAGFQRKTPAQVSDAVVGCAKAMTANGVDMAKLAGMGWARVPDGLGMVSGRANPDSIMFQHRSSKMLISISTKGTIAGTCTATGSIGGPGERSKLEELVSVSLGPPQRGARMHMLKDVTVWRAGHASASLWDSRQVTRSVYAVHIIVEPVPAGLE